jgi:hypothetical protein
MPPDLHHDQNAAAPEAKRDLAYWRSRPMSDRIAEVENLRRQWLAEHDPEALNRPMGKVWRVTKLHDSDGS